MYFRRANTDSGGPIRIQEGQYGFRRANTDSGGSIQIQGGQYRFRRANTGFSRANTEPSRGLRKANTKLSMHFSFTGPT